MGNFQRCPSNIPSHMLYRESIKEQLNDIVDAITPSKDIRRGDEHKKGH